MNDNKKYWVNEKNLEWYRRQFKNPYRRTVAMEEFVASNQNISNQNILDMAGGCGSATYYFAKKHEDATFVVQDVNTSLFEMYQENQNNMSFEYGDIYKLNEKDRGRFNGILCIQTLSWLPDYKEPIKQLCGLGAEWMAFSSLFYPGKINYTIKLENYERPSETEEYSTVNYNIYSVPLLKDYFAELGYEEFIYLPYEIDMDLKKPDHYDLGNYTVKTDDEHRMLFNTCLYMPEGFIFVRKK